MPTPTFYMNASGKIKPFEGACAYQKKKIFKALFNLESYIEFYKKELNRKEPLPHQDAEWRKDWEATLKKAESDLENIMAGKIAIG